jgi:hypothetical protein
LIPPGKLPGSVISNWQAGDILIGRLHLRVAERMLCKITQGRGGGAGHNI